MDDIASRSSHEFKNLKTIWDGKKYAKLDITTEPISTIGNGRQIDIFMGMMMRNSYDGTSVLGFELFMFNLQCTNQYINRNRFGFWAIRHTQGQMENWDVTDALANLGDGATNLIKYAPRLKSLIEKPLEVMDIVKTKQQISFPPSRWGSVLDKLEEPTQWGLFQAMTNVASNDIKGFTSISTGNRVGEYFIDRVATD